MKKFKSIGPVKFLHFGDGTPSIEVATATDEEIEALRTAHPDTFNTYFEEVKADAKKAEPAPAKTN